MSDIRDIRRDMARDLDSVRIICLMLGFEVETDDKLREVVCLLYRDGWFRRELKGTCCR